MTAFSRTQNTDGSLLLCWELKSVNHRYLDASFRLPESFRFLENNLRNHLRGVINRGKLECQLKFNDTKDNNQSMVINEGLLKAIIATSKKLSDKYLLANDLKVTDALNWPGVVEVTQPDMASLSKEVEYLFKVALAQLQAVRLNEGQALKTFIKTRLNQLNEEVAFARKHIASIGLQTKDKLLSRLHELQLGASEQRIEQEIAIILARLDVSEELDRLQTHMVEVARALDLNEPSGRHLDFLMQELNREANTLSSKSDSATLTQHAVQMKVLIEQMREQIQNIE